MRQGQQNRRGRGRNNSNHSGGRKGQNPLTRSFESNGPEMKIRGTPAHVAEKYMSLARDALASSDPVLAENYLQHAEHYNRIILTYREQQAQQNPEGATGAQNGRQRNQGGGSPADAKSPGNQNTSVSANAAAQPDTPQPAMQSDDAPRERSGRSQRSPRQEGTRPSRSRGTGGQRTSAKRAASQTASEGSPTERQSEQPRRRDRFGEGDEQPQFLRRPVRRSRNGQDDDAAAGSPAETVAKQPVGNEPQE